MTEYNDFQKIEIVDEVNGMGWNCGYGGDCAWNED